MSSILLILLPFCCDTLLEMENNDDLMRRAELAYELAKEVVEKEPLFNEWTPDFQSDSDSKTNYFFRLVSDHDVEVYSIVATRLGRVEMKFSLLPIAIREISVIESLLSDEGAAKLLRESELRELRKRQISMLKLFDLKEEEVPRIVRENTIRILTIFCHNLANTADFTMYDALLFSEVGYLKHVVKPRMKEHWNELGLPRDFNLIRDEDINSIREHDLKGRRFFLGDKKQLLVIENLADEFDGLRKQYSAATATYFRMRKNFFEMNRRASDEEWAEKWDEIREADFPEIRQRHLDELIVNDKLTPYDIANIHLAETYGYNEDRIRKKVTQSRNLKEKSR